MPAAIVYGVPAAPMTLKCATGTVGERWRYPFPVRWKSFVQSVSTPVACGRNRGDDVGPIARVEQDLAESYLGVEPGDDAALDDGVVEQAAFAADPDERDLRSPALSVRRRRKNRIVAALPICRRSPWPATTSNVAAPACERARSGMSSPLARRRSCRW